EPLHVEAYRSHGAKQPINSPSGVRLAKTKGMTDGKEQQQNTRNAIKDGSPHRLPPLRLGRLVAVADLMIRVPCPLEGKAALARAMAAPISASTSGCASWLVFSTWTKRTCFPEPSRRPFGSGNCGPLLRYSRTPSERTAIETMPSIPRSVGE